jgi:hypothetical protein
MAEVLRSDVPEVTLEEPGIEAQNILMEPNVNCSLAVVSPERVSALPRPKVHHLPRSHCERIGEDRTQISPEKSTSENEGQNGHVGVSPEDGDLIDEPIVAEEGSEGTEGVLDVQWERVLEEIVRALFEGDALECVQPILVSLLQLLREGLVRVVGARCHVHKHSRGRGHQRSREDSH